MTKLTALVRAVPESKLSGENVQVEITSLCTDSRAASPGALFFCISGFQKDGHEYAPQAVAGGAVALVVERELPIDCPQVLVSDTRAALSLMAAEFFGNPAKQLKLVGITGTKGKTTTSFLMKSILEAAGHTVGLIGTVGSMIGEKEIPTTLTTPDPVDFQRLLRTMADEGAEYVVMEVSAHALALRKLEGIRFEAAGFSNLSHDHLDFFGDMGTYCEAKMRMFTPERCAKAIYNADDETVAHAMRDLQIPHTAIGIREKAEIYATEIEIGERGCSFSLTFNKRFRIPVQLKLAGVFNVYNAMMAAALCDSLGVSPEALQAGLEAVGNVPGRIELLDTSTPYRVILDYAHSPDSLENILKAIRQTAKARVISLFGCGGGRDHEKRPEMGEISGRLADFTILTSDNPRNEEPGDILGEIEEGIRKTDAEYIVIENRRQAILHALSHAEPGDVIVLAGKGHETYQEIKGVKHPFDEKIVVAELLKELAR